MLLSQLSSALNVITSNHGDAPHHSTALEDQSSFVFALLLGERETSRLA